MILSIDTFFELLSEEISINKELRSYHKFCENTSATRNAFRKAYFIQRLAYLRQCLEKLPNQAQIWDVGCGYGSESIFMALLLPNAQVFGSTLEYYYELLPQRLDFWKQKGFDLSNLTFEYQNLFDCQPSQKRFDLIFAQDTLHHVEPITKALIHLQNCLNPTGKMVVCEENGSNLINTLVHFRQRGFKRVGTYYDKQKDINIPFGNENTRSLEHWEKLLLESAWKIDPNSVEYIRFYFPRFYRKYSLNEIIAKEQKLWPNHYIFRKYFFFGINFTAEICKPSNITQN
ncbi:MAG: class I SAM-dependent methyltransferase [Bacteroidales bacterium]